MKTRNFLPIVAASICVAGFMASCGRAASRNADSSPAVETDEFHADNDIAMTVRSVADAINVGEILLPEDYDFDGVLTDGEGYPLYTNLQGMPGRWDIDVVSDSCIYIRNIDLGDLLVDDLEQYLSATLRVDETNLVDSLSETNEGGRVVSVYDFGSGLMRFETHLATAPNGMEAPICLITLTSK